MTPSLKEHWNQKYANQPITELGWYESRSFPSIQLIEQCAIPKHSPIVDIGSGTSVLISNLLELGYQNLYAVDISEVALEKAKALLAKEGAAQVHWVVDDITAPVAVLQIQNAAIWHDRAVFHFLTENNSGKPIAQWCKSVDARWLWSSLPLPCTGRQNAAACRYNDTA
jgi:SAM-dependent methyltransferase